MMIMFGFVNIYVYLFTKRFPLKVGHKYGLDCVFLSLIQKVYYESLGKASINRDVSLCVSLGLSRGNTSGRQSVALQTLCHRVKVDHLELCQVTAAAARLLANHHLEGRPARIRSGKQLARHPAYVKPHRTRHHGAKSVA